MSVSSAVVTLSPRDYDAVLFDLDGVLTPTASVHAKAWKRLFDDFLKHRAQQTGEPFVPFDSAADYARYVDGKPREEGAIAFLRSRGIDLPPGTESDPPGETSIRALAKLKDQYFMQALEQEGVQPFEAVVELLRTLRAQDLGIAVVSSSKNCARVLEAAGLSKLADTRVDGNDLAQYGLRGKPAPDSFVEAARRLGADVRRTVVVEDAIAGVEAARAGGFGYIIGVDRVGNSRALREAGAHEVVTSLAQIQVTTEPPSSWSLVYENFDPAREGIRESLCALGNGYFTTRGAAPWARADGVHYPGTYLAGGYNRLRTDIGDRTVENESLVNFPNWLTLRLRPDGEEWFDERNVKLISYRQELDLRCGLLMRAITFEHGKGRRSTLRECRFVSMANMHAAALEITLTAENWSGRVTVHSALDGRVINNGAKLYERFNKQHLEPVAQEIIDEDQALLHVRTSQSRIYLAEGMRTRVFRDGELLTPKRRNVVEPSYVAQEIDLEIAEGQTLRIEKLVFLYSSRDPAISEPGVAVTKALARATPFEELRDGHKLAWKHLWRRFDVHLVPVGSFRLNIPMLLRLNLFHLLQAASLNSIGLDIGVPARGWTGEAYEGHIFWDELFIFPTITFRTPEITRSLLMYRYRRLDEARAAARSLGYRGAMFPWQSGSDGQEETQEVNLNPRSQRWMVDNTYLQRHVGSAIAWNVWQYYQTTLDMEFLQFYGAELLFEIARFWASIATYNEQRGRYEIHGVMGPDEFHDAYPGADKPGLNNNAYTNIMAAWVLWRARDIYEKLPDIRRVDLTTELGLTRDELDRWDDISRRMFVPFHGDGIISQFEGFEALEELDWDHYRARYGNIQRLDLILEAEGDTPNRYKLNKQADVLMLFYLFSAEELYEILDRLGYSYDRETIPKNVAYYDARSSHGSTLSRVVHAWVLARSDRPRAITYYAEALQSDVSDIQQGTTSEGIHLGAMAGTVDLVQRVATGIEVAGDVLRLNPYLPEMIQRLDMRIRYRGHTLDLRLTHECLTIRGRDRLAPPIWIAVCDEKHLFEGGSTHNFPLCRKQ
ncbi:MAG TPA: beta-phosphoglucomutase family hydrolase [Steroidobacteraceae bacterium]